MDSLRARFFAAILVSLMASQLCFGGITTIGPFAGDFSESFESFPAGPIPGTSTELSGPASILSGQGILTGVHTIAFNPTYVWNSTGGFSLGTNGTAVPFDGLQGLALNSVSTFHPTVRFEFPTPVTDFGGYWVHAKTSTQGGPVDLTFYDATDTVIGTDDFTYTSSLGGVSEWYGWNSTTPIGAVEFTGFFAGVDGVQIKVPEPSTCIFLTAAALGTLRRRQLNIS